MWIEVYLRHTSAFLRRHQLRRWSIHLDWWNCTSRGRLAPTICLKYHRRRNCYSTFKDSLDKIILLYYINESQLTVIFLAPAGQQLVEDVEITFSLHLWYNAWFFKQIWNELISEIDSNLQCSISAPAILPVVPKWIRMNFPCTSEMITVNCDCGDLRIEKSCCFC